MREQPTCPACLRRAAVARQLNEQLAQLRAELSRFRARTDAAWARDLRERREAEVERMYRAGHTVIEVARSLGLSHPGVIKILERRQVPRRPRGWRRAA